MIRVTDIKKVRIKWTTKEMQWEIDLKNMKLWVTLSWLAGAACLKTPGAGWSVTLNIPMFKGDEGRNFIERYIYVNE